jgi:hypothetical protein
VQWQSDTVASAYDVGAYSSLALLPGGIPAIAYHVEASGAYGGDLCYADRVSDYWLGLTVAHLGDVGTFPSLAIRPNGEPVVAYRDNDYASLQCAWRTSAGWQHETVDDTSDVGWYASLAILPSGQPAIAYFDWTTADLRFAALRPTGDCNCDGDVTWRDIDPFVDALAGPAVYGARHPTCHWLLADCDGDGAVTWRDIDPFVSLLGR